MKFSDSKVFSCKCTPIVPWSISDIPYDLGEWLAQKVNPLLLWLDSFEKEDKSVGSYETHEQNKVYKSAREWTMRDPGGYDNFADKQMVWIWSINFRKSIIGNIITGYSNGKNIWVRRVNGL